MKHTIIAIFATIALFFYAFALPPFYYWYIDTYLQDQAHEASLLPFVFCLVFSMAFFAIVVYCWSLVIKFNNKDEKTTL